MEGGGGQADKKCIEVVQYVVTQAVDGAVALVGDADVEGLDGNGGIVLHGGGLALRRGRIEVGKLLRVGREFLTFEYGVDPLVDGDAHLVHGAMRPDCSSWTL